MEGSVWQDGPAYLKLPETDWPVRTDIMSGTVELPSKELRKQYKHLAFQLAAKQVKPAEKVMEKRESMNWMSSQNQQMTGKLLHLFLQNCK